MWQSLVIGQWLRGLEIVEATADRWRKAGGGAIAERQKAVLYFLFSDGLIRWASFEAIRKDYL